MKTIRVACIIIALTIIPMLGFGQPVMNGTFDGVAVWGSPVATNPTAGWAGANAQALYVTSDEDYIYFGAEVSAASWQSFGFVVNTTDNENGISNDVWGYPITYGHSLKPKFVIKGNFGGYAELREWNGNSGHTLIGEIVSSARGISTAFVEVKILKSVLNNPSRLDVQFYISGDNGTKHATFDAVPADQVVSSNGSARFRLIVEPGQTTNLGGDAMLPASFSLNQNFPNPFNPTTSISFTLPADAAGNGVVRLTVFDMLGREVARLVDGQLSAGTHTVRFDASGLGSGIYVYRLEAGGMVMSRRMTFVK